MAKDSSSKYDLSNWVMPSWVAFWLLISVAHVITMKTIFLEHSKKKIGYRTLYFNLSARPTSFLKQAITTATGLDMRCIIGLAFSIVCLCLTRPRRSLSAFPLTTSWTHFTIAMVACVAGRAKARAVSHKSFLMSFSGCAKNLFPGISAFYTPHQESEIWMGQPMSRVKCLRTYLKNCCPLTLSAFSFVNLPLQWPYFW